MKNAPQTHLVTAEKPPANAAAPWDVYASDCPTRIVLDRVADKWATLVLGLLSQHPWRFNALLRKIEGLSQKVLSQTLKRLERDGLVSRTAFATVPVTVEYSITPLGGTLAHSLSALIAWAEQNIQSVQAAQRAFDAKQHEPPRPTADA